ncbi:MAG TPA: hypothetical protein DCZ94_12975 [Lentisphaeria bacterium]|nr:MAG: hypothetical protein A2X48_06105 [Lentisphaerae bacterium GWF2_49_21]HBC87861.1 hypothetical protein [Lentisphaeria bacterium]
MKRKILFNVFLIVLCSIILSSCETIPQPLPQLPLSEFSEAVSVTAENNMAAYAEIEKVHQDVELMKIVANFDNKGFKPDSVRPFFDSQALKVRKQVLDGLCLYSEKLSGISDGKQLEEFDEETRKLGASLQELNEGLMKSSFFRNTQMESSSVQVFSTAVNAIGRWIIEYKKDKAVRETIIGMNVNIRDICTLFMQDFGNPPDGMHKNPGGLRAQQWNQHDELMLLQDKFIGDNKNKMDPVAKKLEIEKLASLPMKQKEADAVLADMQNSFKRIRDIHDALAKDAVGEKQDYELMLKKLIAEGKRIGKFYKSVKN